MPPSNLISALEELARRRTELTSAIVTLAAVAGVDAAPYLGARAVSQSEPPFGATAKEPPPPRPQRPASRATNGTGRAHKVRRTTRDAAHDALSPTAQSILDAVAKAKEPMAPRDLAKVMGIDVSLVSYHVRNLAKAGRVATSGNTSNRRVSLP